VLPGVAQLDRWEPSAPAADTDPIGLTAYGALAASLPERFTISLTGHILFPCAFNPVTAPKILPMLSLA
jgi:hypothetical protein